MTYPSSGATGGYAPYAAMLFAGAALWWGSAFHATSMPFWAPWDFSPLWFLTATLALYWYARGLAHTAAADRPAWWRPVLYFGGVALIWTVLQTHFEYMAQHMFFLNRLQHVAMHHVGPFLIALAWPGEMLMRGIPEPARRLVRCRPLSVAVSILQQPFLALVLFFGLIALWLTPAVHFRAMIDPKLYAVMNWSMVVDGLLFWCLVLDPRPAPPAFASFGARALLPMLVMFPQIMLGALIAFAHHDIYTFYAWCGRLYPSIGAVDDQQFGGLIVWIPSAMMSVIALIVVMNALRRVEESQLNEEDDDDDGGLVISSAHWTGR